MHEAVYWVGFIGAWFLFAGPVYQSASGHYKAVARGWWYVGFGAWCIFLKEGWELAEHREWTNAGYWILVVVLTMVALGGAGAGGDREGRQRGRVRRAP